MTPLVFWFDPISPYSHLAFARLPQVLAGRSVEVSYRPVLFAAMLQHWGQKGPAEIGPKRDWTYRDVLWRARRDGVRLELPAAHPFNSLALLRLAWACSPDPAAGISPSRWVCEQVLQHAWHGGGVADDPARLAELRDRLSPAHDPGSDLVKQCLRRETEAAVQARVFGVPTVEAGGRHYWGDDGLAMLAAALGGDAWFDGPDWDAAAALPVGVTRAR